MKIHRVVLFVIDFDGLGAEGVRAEVARVRYPNDCVSPKVMSVETWDIGEWHDDHPLNLFHDAEKGLFSTPPESTLGGE